MSTANLASNVERLREFALRFRDRKVPLDRPVTVVGRHTDCHLLLDGSLVSRRHAAIRLLEIEGSTVVEVEDLGSRNGVFVNGSRISTPTRLKLGDRVAIGGEGAVLVEQPPHDQSHLRNTNLRQAMTLTGLPAADLPDGEPTATHARSSNAPATSADSRGADPTRADSSGTDSRSAYSIQAESTRARFPHESAPPSTGPSSTGPSSTVPAPADEEDSETRAASALSLLEPLFEKALRLKRPEDAKRYVGKQLETVVEALRTGRAIDSGLTEAAASFAVRLADAQPRGQEKEMGYWASVAIEIYRHKEQVMPQPLVDTLYSVLRAAKGFDEKLLREYVESLSIRSEELSPAQRFGLKRLKGLVQIANL